MFLNKIIKICIYLLVFLIPVFFLPFSFEDFEFNKQYLLFFLVLAAFFAWIARMVLVQKEIRFKKSSLDLFVLIFLGVSILSAIFSVDKNSSLFGFFGRFSDGLIGLLSLGILYFLITNNVEEKVKKLGKISSSLISAQGLVKTFFGSAFLVTLFSYFSIFGIWTKLNNILGGKLPKLMLQKTFNPVSASMEGLAIFLTVVIVFLVGRWLFWQAKEKFSAIANWILLIASLGLLIIVDAAASWLVIAISFSVALGFLIGKRIFKQQVNKLLLPIFLIILAIICLCIPLKKEFQELQLEHLASLPTEQVLAQPLSWQIAFKSVISNVKSGVLGSGIGTWHSDFAKFKPVEFNQTPLLWQIRFDRAGNYWAEILGTTGFLGFFSFLAMIGIFLMLSWYFCLKPKIREIFPYWLAFVTLIVSQIFYYQNMTLAFTFWLVLGLSVVSWQKSSSTSIKEKAFSFKDFPELSLVLSMLLILVGFTIIGMWFFAGKFYLADIYYKKALVRGDTQNLEKAVKLNPYQPQYKIFLARGYLNKVLTEMVKPPEKRDQKALSLNAHRAIIYAKGGELTVPQRGRPIKKKVKGATSLAPYQVTAWENLGIIYRELRQVAAGASEWGIKAFEKAVTLEPTNPVLYTELGKLYLVQNQTQKAKKAFEKAKALKPDYIPALIQEALILEREGNPAKAITRMESLAQTHPLNTEILFQLGRLYYNNKQIDQAIAQFKQVLSIFPNHSNALYSLGLAYQTKGETDPAIKAFERVLELNPGNVDVIQKLEQLRKEK